MDRLLECILAAAYNDGPYCISPLEQGIPRCGTSSERLVYSRSC